MATYLDTETCGLHGPIALLQYAKDDGETILWSPWKETVLDTIKLIEEIAADEVIGFNLAFDWFHLCQMYTTLLELDDCNAILEDCIEEYALKEPQARLGPCLKPKSALDIMLYARKGPYQSTMARDDIRIRRVPTCLAWELASELENRIKLKDIYFARRKNKNAEKWKVFDIKNEEGIINPHFKDVVLKFHPTSALKALAIDALGLDKDDTLIFADISIPKKMYPVEYGYAPFALAVGTPSDWRGAWPHVIRYHIDHWAYHPLARKYAANDVIYLQRLRKHFGDIPCGDDDSVLACAVGAVRWHGYSLDIPYIKELREKALKAKEIAPTAPKKVKWWVGELMSEEEKLVMRGSTKKVILEEIAEMLTDCPDCKGLGCEKCEHRGTVKHPAAERAKLCLDARKADKRRDVLDKLLRAGRLHASFIVVGTKSSRMAGTDDLNPQGMDHTKEFRRAFILKDKGFDLPAGDFSAFEICLADAVYDDPDLRKDLQSGKSIHSVFAMELFPGMTYEEIEASKGSKIKDYRDYGKRGVFAVLYGGDENTLKKKLNIDLDIAKKAVEGFVKKRYKRIGLVQAITRDRFCSMRQPKGIGTSVVWSDPADYVESKTGFRRYYTLENQICKALFDLANKPPKHWKEFKMRVVRRDREQFAFGAVQSALYGCAFGLQSANMRSSVNHEIQSYGAVLTKRLQRRIWELQPEGANPWNVVPMNVHDEILTPARPEIVPKVRETVNKFIEDTQPMVPLIAIEWHDNMDSWADK